MLHSLALYLNLNSAKRPLRDAPIAPQFPIGISNPPQVPIGKTESKSTPFTSLRQIQGSPNVPHNTISMSIFLGLPHLHGLLHISGGPHAFVTLCRSLVFVCTFASSSHLSFALTPCHSSTFIHAIHIPCGFRSARIRTPRVHIRIPFWSNTFVGSWSAPRPFRMHKGTLVLRSH